MEETCLIAQSVKIPNFQYEKLKKIAVKETVSVSAVIRWAIEKYLDKNTINNGIKTGGQAR